MENDTSYDRNYESDVKLVKYQTNCGTTNLIFRNYVPRDTKLKFYKVLAVSVLSYVCELWTTTKKQDKRKTGLEIVFLKGVKRRSKLDRIRNEAISCLLYTSRCV